MKKSNNLFTIYGLNNCLNLLDNYKNRFTIDCIYIMKDSKAASNQIIQRKIKELSVKFLDKKTFFNQFSYKHTQGIVISFSGYKPYNFIKYNDDTLNQCYIIIDQMSDPQNLGQIIRTSECAGIDGIILTKLDGTAKGGIVFALANELNIPIHFIGVGEKIDDLQLFDASKFVDSLLGKD